MTAAPPPPQAAQAEAPAARTPVGSPCTGVCKMDRATGWCLGCARTIDEIAAWSTLDDAARRAVWQALPPRQQQLRALHGPAPVPEKRR